MESHLWVAKIVESDALDPHDPPDEVLGLGPGTWSTEQIEEAKRKTMTAVGEALNRRQSGHLSAIAILGAVRQAAHQLKEESGTSPAPPTDNKQTTPPSISAGGRTTQSRSPQSANHPEAAVDGDPSQRLPGSGVARKKTVVPRDEFTRTVETRQPEVSVSPEEATTVRIFRPNGQVYRATTPLDAAPVQPIPVTSRSKHEEPAIRDRVVPSNGKMSAAATVTLSQDTPAVHQQPTVSIDIDQLVSASIVNALGRQLGRGVVLDETQEAMILEAVVRSGIEPSAAKTAVSRQVRTYRRSAIVAAIGSDLHRLVTAAQMLSTKHKDRIPSNAIYQRQVDDQVGILSKMQGIEVPTAEGLVAEAIAKCGLQVSSLDWPPDRPKSLFQRMFG